MKNGRYHNPKKEGKKQPTTQKTEFREKKGSWLEKLTMVTAGECLPFDGRAIKLLPSEGGVCRMTKALRKQNKGGG